MKMFNISMAVFLVLVLIFGMSLSVLAFPNPPDPVEDPIGDPPGDDPGDDPVDDPNDDPEPDPPTKVKGNNGFGNGDQDAPGNSKAHNNAENANNGSGREYPGKSGH